ncbi:MAG TPA: hypothetical protein VES19_12355, partial [Candidatus Limnocylindrales bacterium]|nr:hypothetical protein [Candidatus Limnocylindrales bacterium]
TSLKPMVWSGGIYVIARTDGGEVWELDVMRHSARDTGVRLTPGVPAEARLAPSGYGVAISSGSTVAVHWFDREPQDRVIDLPGSEATFSPDGTLIASVGRDAKAAVSVWLTDPWAATAPTQIATLPVATPHQAEPASTYCIQWLPEVDQ